MTCVDIEGVSYLKFYSSIKCNEDLHQFYLIFFGYVWSVIIAFGVPLAIIIYSRRLAYGA